MRRLTTNARARAALVGRTIAHIDLNLAGGEAFLPTITLDDTKITFDVVDYGSGTYGIVLRADKPRSKP